MNFDEVKKVLSQQLNQPVGDGKKRNIVFWYDEGAEFADEVDGIEIENVKLLRITHTNAFHVKYILDKLDTESHFLIYSSEAKPVPRENWLLDVLKYSQEFSTDKTTVIMRELGIKDIGLKPIFKKYLKFFNAQDRRQKFASYGLTLLTDKRLHLAVISAICKLSYPNFEEVVKCLFLAMAEGSEELFENIKKFEADDALWMLLRERFGYHDIEDSLEKFMMMLLVAHMESELKAKTFPLSWSNLLPQKEVMDRMGLKKMAPDKDRMAAAVVLLDHFMNHEVDGSAYDILADQLSKVLKVEDYMNGWNVTEYQYCDTFRVFDEEVINYITSHLVDKTGEYDRYLALINMRRTGHWYKHYESSYKALIHAIESLRLESNLVNQLMIRSAVEMMALYASDYQLMDYHYRKFCRAYEAIEHEGLVKLNELIESTYVVWYLNELSNKWSMALEDFVEVDYRIQGINQQKDFFTTTVQRHLKADERVFVIISDALRYEAAKELTDALNAENRGQADLDYMQGVIPSYTKLGMAALLPHETLTMTDKGDILANGISTSGTENRGKILSIVDPNSIAITYDTLRDLKRSELREKLVGKRLVYIYHDRIDNTGHSSESDVFEAVERSIDEIKGLVTNLVNNVSATNIYITSDHGFIYQRTELAEADKLSKGDLDSLEEGRRFILTKETRKKESTFTIPLTYILAGSDLNAVVPRGNNRFKVKGNGSKYAHEGLSLQEIVIPLVKFKNIRKDEFASKKVAVQLTSITRKLTNRISYLDFYQAEKISDKMLLRRLKLYLIDELGQRISNENIIIADSASDQAENRTFREKFTLRDMKYDRAQKYYLIIEDEDEPVEKEYERIVFNIDLLISDEFGF